MVFIAVCSYSLKKLCFKKNYLLEIYTEIFMSDMICQVCASKVIWGWGTGSLQVNQDFGN